MTNCLLLYEKFDSQTLKLLKCCQSSSTGWCRYGTFISSSTSAGWGVNQLEELGGGGTGRGLLLERAASLHGCRTCVLGVQKVRTQSCRSVSDSSPHFISAVSDKVCVTWLTYSCFVLFLYCDKPEGRLRLTSDGFRAKQCDLHSKILSCAKMCFRLDVGRFHIRHLFIYKINNVCM